MKSGFTLVLVLISVLTSFLSCIWLLWTIQRRLSARDRQRLFPRQLRSLGLAGLLLSGFGTPIVVIDMGDVHGSWASSTCTWVFPLFRTMRFISCIQEAYLGVTFALQCVRAKRMLRCLRHGIIPTWLVGLALGIGDAFWHPFHFQDDDICMTDHRQFMPIVAMSICLFASCIASVMIFCRAMGSNTTLAVETRMVKRAIWYPLISIIAYTPILIVYWTPDLFHQPFFVFAVICEMGSGAMNAGMYGLQSHYARKLANSDRGSAPEPSEDAEVPTTEDDDMSFNVQFGGVEVQDISTHRFSSHRISSHHGRSDHSSFRSKS